MDGRRRITEGTVHMRALGLSLALLCLPVTAQARQASLRLFALPAVTRVTQLPGRSLSGALRPPVETGSEAQLRIDDALSQAQNNLISALALAQHLGNPYRTWLWVTPTLGEVKGATVRFDLPSRW